MIVYELSVCMVKITVDIIIADVLNKVSELPSTYIRKMHPLTKNLCNSMYIHKVCALLSVHIKG